MSKIKPHPDDYTGLPYLATVTIGEEVHTAVVDFVYKNKVHYYALDTLGFDNCSAFLLVVEEYHNSGASKEVPLSVFISANNYSHVCAHGYQIIKLSVGLRIEGFCPMHWFAVVRKVWRKRDLATNTFTGSKHRRSPAEIEADKAAKLARKLKRLAAANKQ